MGYPSEPSRIGRGGQELRNRYLRRARFICTNDGLLSNITMLRNRWNAAYPDHRIVPSSALRAEPPESISRVTRNAFAGERQTLQGSPHQVSPPLSRSIPNLLGEWQWLAIPIRDQLFPEQDFWNPFTTSARAQVEPSPNLPSAIQHPANGFVNALLQHMSPHALTQCVDELFPQSHFQLLRLEPMVHGIDPGRFDGAIDRLSDLQPWEIEELASMPWCITVYPGMTRKDIVDAASALANEVAKLYESRSVAARIEELRTEYERPGLNLRPMSHGQIADQLGLGEDAVRRHLKRTSAR